MAFPNFEDDCRGCLSVVVDLALCHACLQGGDLNELFRGQRPLQARNKTAFYAENVCPDC